MVFVRLKLNEMVGRTVRSGTRSAYENGNVVSEFSVYNPSNGLRLRERFTARAASVPRDVRPFLQNAFGNYDLRREFRTIFRRPSGTRSLMRRKYTPGKCR